MPRSPVRSVTALVAALMITAAPAQTRLPAPLSAAQPSATARLIVDAEVRLNERPDVRLSGLAPHAPVRMHYFIELGIWSADAGGAAQERATVMHGWGAYRADARGRVDMAVAQPLAGTSRQVGPETLIWSAHRPASPALASVGAAAGNLPRLPRGTVLVRAEQDGTIIAESRFALNVAIPNTTVVEIDTPELAGVFAAPPGGSRRPTIIHLHGSEGGSLANARADAERYAAQGFATLAIAYFAWPRERGALTIPSAHRNIDVAQLERARSWLANRSEADVNRIALVGNSKGAEFALVGAATYPWVRAAVACVPTDVVWEGYGATAWNAEDLASAPPRGTYSSWSIAGQPLPYIPTYAGRNDRDWPTNGARYAQARAEFPDAAIWARIPIERTSARLFLIGGGRDRTWASGAMSQTIADTMRRAGRGRQVETLIAPTADHYLCGNGLWPDRAYQNDLDGPNAPDIDAQGAAAVVAHFAKLAFLRRVLR